MTPNRLRHSKQRQATSFTVLGTMFAFLVICLFCRGVRVDSFSSFVNKRWKDATRTRLRPCRSLSSSVSSQSTNLVPTGESYSTLTLLEHVHLLTQDVHDDIIDMEINGVLDFFVRVLGFGLDPKSVDNVKKGSGMIWHLRFRSAQTSERLM